jgi:hypothetical protein
MGTRKANGQGYTYSIGGSYKTVIRHKGRVVTATAKTVQESKRMAKERVYHSSTKLEDSYRLYLEGKDVKRFAVHWGGHWLKYGECLAAPRDPKLFSGDRILVRQIPSKPPYSINAWFTDSDFINDINSMIIRDFNDVNPFYILGLLNSRLLTFWFINTFDKFQRKTFPQFKVNELASFPIFRGAEVDEKRIMDLAKLLQQNYQKLGNEDMSQTEIQLLNENLNKLNKELDMYVYQVAQLTKEEIGLVEAE